MALGGHDFALRSANESVLLTSYFPSTGSIAKHHKHLRYDCRPLYPYVSMPNTIDPHFTTSLLPCMILFLVLVLATLFFVPTLRLKICSTDSKGHQKSDESYTTKDTESYGFTLGFYMRPK